MDRIQIVGDNNGGEPRFDLWGELVKKWAKGEAPRPSTVDELVQQCTDAGVTIDIPRRYFANPVQFAQADENTVLIRLPPDKLVRDSEERLMQADMTYALPPFYKRIFQNVNPVIPQNEKLKVHAERIGDYSMSACQ
jgi:hypothetical protein